MYPPHAKSDTAVPRTVEQIASQKLAKIVQYFRVAGRVQPVASVIDPQAG